MKKLVTFAFLAIFTISATFNVSAQSTEKTNKAKHRIYIKVNQDNLVVLRADLLPDQKRLNYVLNISDDNGEIFYVSTFLRKKPVYKAFDLSKSPEGKYTFKIFSKNKPIYSKTIVNKKVENKYTKQLLAEEL